MQPTVLDPAAVKNVDRVLVASPDAQLAALVRVALEQSRLGPNARAVGVGQVSDHVSALGAVATQGAPDVLLMHISALDDPLPAAADATRKLAPRSRLVLVAPQGARVTTVEALAAGFDDLLIEPIDPRKLGEAMAVYLGAQASATAASTAPASRPAAAPPIELGDGDLIEQLLAHSGQTRDVAMSILRRQSGVGTLGWCKSQHDLPAGTAAERVEFNGATFGLLYAPRPVSAARLQEWAGWLGRWLALEQRMDQLWEMALRDELTGAWNRRYFQRFLRTVLQRATNERFRVTVMIFDIDDFKIYNDKYGHGAGDEILRESARLMLSVVRDHDVVARIGGDEFGVIFWDSEGPRKPGSDHPMDVTQAARRFQKAICEHKFPKLLDEAPGNLTISGGLASFPWDGRTPEELQAKADEMALQSKRQGKNAITFGPGAARVCHTING